MYTLCANSSSTASLSSSFFGFAPRVAKPIRFSHPVREALAKSMAARRLRTYPANDSRSPHSECCGGVRVSDELVVEEHAVDVVGEVEMLVDGVNWR